MTRTPGVHRIVFPARHDWFENIQAGAKRCARLDLPQFKPEGLLFTLSVAVIKDYSLHAGKEFEKKSGGDVG